MDQRADVGCSSGRSPLLVRVAPLATFIRPVRLEYYLNMPLTIGVSFEERVEDLEVAGDLLSSSSFTSFLVDELSNELISTI